MTTALEVNLSIDITPEKVAISDFHITQVSDSDLANQAFQHLKDNQQNILSKLVTVIKHFFGFDDELQLEDSSPKAAM